MMPRIGWLATIALVGFGVTPGFALDPQRAITQFVHTAWTEKEGAPSDIRALAQTTDGYLWLGTTGGLFHFDGVRFARFEPRRGEVFPSTRIVSLLATRDGALWVVFRPGNVVRLLNGHMNSYSEPEGLPPVLALVESIDGSVIAGTARGLARFEDGAWKDAGKDWEFPAKEARQVYFDKSGTLWVVTEDRVIYHPAGGRGFVDPGDMFGGGGNLAQALDGAVWLADTGRSAHTLPQVGDRGPITEVRVGASSLLFDRNGSLWIGTVGDGLRRVAYPNRIDGRAIAQFGPEAEPFTAKDGLSGDYVSCLLEDHEGNIWSGTIRGLDRFRESTFTTVAVPHPDFPRGVLATRDGSLWTYSVGGVGFLRIRPDGKQEPVSELAVSSMCEDGTGNLWFVEGDSLDEVRNGHWAAVRLPQGIHLKAMIRITCDRAGGIWLFDSTEGLFRFADGAITRVSVRPDRTIGWGDLYTDRQDRVWLGQYDRITLYEHGKQQDFGSRDGVPAGVVLTFYQDRAGNVWAGGDGGLSKFENGHFRSFSPENGVPARSIYGLTEDDQGYWWLATDIGVLRIPGGELDRALANPAYRIRYESFNTFDGLPGKPRQVPPLPVVARTTDGRIWFATSNGLAYVDPRRVPKNAVAPPVHVEAVRIDGKEVAPSNGVSFSHRTNELEIDYTALSLSIPERVLFRFKLEGKDTGWHNVGPRRQAYYGSLAPRKYTFRVMACNNDGVWNEAGAAWSFSVTPAFYQTFWFEALCVLAGVLLLAGAYRLRIHQVATALNVRFDERLAERTRLAREFHDTLLQTIQGSKMVADDALKHNSDATKMQQAMERLSEWLGQAVEEGRSALSSLRSSTTEQNDMEEALRRAGEECKFQRPIEFVLSVRGESREMHPIVRDEVYRIGYEAIRNACAHSEGSQLNVKLSYVDDLVLQVCDNGKGIDPELAASGKGGHFGVTGMHERASRLHGRLTISGGPDSGTQVKLVVPDNIAFRQSNPRGIRRFLRK
ncbi:MAG TPA: two-component regulator propeller domain-containing protein [Bryobacteraceae bacterium]|nr:two-component regulator propeller domain-containing protein [Bryobacteraceae bacterium]